MFVRPTWAEIDLHRIDHNVRVMHGLLPQGTQLMAVVKANGYGHGAEQVARTALKAGATWLAVASADEGIELREAGIEAPILLLGYTPPEGAEAVVRHGLTPTVYQDELLDALSAAAVRAERTVGVHLKVDTGMGRIGLRGADEALAFAKRAAERPGLKLEAVFTHFATADEADLSYADEQAASFREIKKSFAEQGLEPPLWHISNSAAILQYQECGGNLVRLGISMYGYYPSDEVPRTVELLPALRLLSKIVHLKEVPAGTKVSYGATFVTERTSKIATLPIGYADGYSRLLSNRGEVLVRGRRVPVVGRVCMDQLMLDVTDVEGVELGDEVVLYGEQGAEEIALEEVAAHIGTIPYEVCCALGQRVPRVYRGGNGEAEVSGTATDL